MVRQYCCCMSVCLLCTSMSIGWFWTTTNNLWSISFDGGAVWNEQRETQDRHVCLYPHKKPVRTETCPPSHYFSLHPPPSRPPHPFSPQQPLSGRVYSIHICNICNHAPYIYDISRLHMMSVFVFSATRYNTFRILYWPHRPSIDRHIHSAFSIPTDRPAPHNEPAAPNWVHFINKAWSTSLGYTTGLTSIIRGHQKKQ